MGQSRQERAALDLVRHLFYRRLGTVRPASISIRVSVRPPDTRKGDRHKPRKGDRHRPGYRRPNKRNALPFWGIDGEGQGRAPHRYTLLAAVSETGEREYIEGNITAERALDFILSLPTRRLFAYSFGYDLTKILADLPNELLHALVNEDERPGENPKTGPAPIYWKARAGKVYALNLQRTKFSVRLCRNDRRIGIALRGKAGPRPKTTTIWDIWKFFQGKFTSALTAWQIGTEDEIEKMARMKDQRADFDQLDRLQVREYCFDECQKMAELARALTKAHDDCGLKLQNYFGAGSSASAMLKVMSIKGKRGSVPSEMLDAIAKAFVAGRFENSVIGTIPGPVYGYDISSAYPYELFHLPCLEHGRWRYTKRRKDLEHCRQALVHYGLGRNEDPHATWGPFPWRDGSGSICFPIESDGGWTYLPEFQIACEAFEHVRFKEAYVLESDCVCRPFARIAEWYRERKALGGDTRGIVLKLGMNSCYGKLAQSIGQSPPYQCWLWAGMITSGTRARILEALHYGCSSHDKLLMIATDGILTTEPLTLPAPNDTGTSDMKEPLGMWTSDVYPKGVFFARPGIYFPLNPTVKELKSVRARGIGKAVMAKGWSALRDQYEAGFPIATITPAPVRFFGIKSSIHRSKAGFSRAEYYGEWRERPLQVSFDPMPKRERVSPDDGITLLLRSVRGQGESRPYTKAVDGESSPESIMLDVTLNEQNESHDGGDFALY